MSNDKSPFIDKDTANIAYQETKTWIRQYDQPFDEFERIARNKPSPGIDKNLPKVTDGTMAAIVQEQPKRIIQQTPTGLVGCKDYPDYATVAGLVLTDKLLPSWKAQGTALQKGWNMIGKALTYGVQASYSYFTNSNGEMHTDFVLPYIKDVLSEKGKVFAPDSNILFMRSWYQPRDIKAIINKEKKLLEVNPKYVSDWDLKLLAQLLDDGNGVSKSSEFQTPAEREKGTAAGGIEVIHAFQMGVGAEFYSFSPRFEQGKALRTKVNKDPRGKMPLDFMYCNIDLSNPRGRGQVELSGGVQNLIDQQMQMFQFMTTYQQAPALKTWGNVNKASLKFRPNAIWDMGSNPANKVERDMVSDVAITSFPGNFGLLKSQILALNSSQDNSISSEAGNPTQSKTPAGVKNQQVRLGVSDNYLRKQYEAWFGDVCETNLNLFFSEMQGKGTVTVKKDDQKDLSEFIKKQFMDAEGELEIPYGKINDTVFRFEVDASSSEVKDDSDNADKLIQALELAMKVPDPEIQKAIPKLFRKIVEEIGVEGADDLFPDAEELDAQGQPVKPQGPDPQMMQQQQEMQQKVQELQQKLQEEQQVPYAQAPESIKRQKEARAGYQPATDVSPAQGAIDLNAQKNVLAADQQAHNQTLALDQHVANQNQPPEVPPTQGQDAPPDVSLHPDEQQIIQHILKAGFTPEDATHAIVMLRGGMDEKQILQTLVAKRGSNG